MQTADISIFGHRVKIDTEKIFVKNVTFSFGCAREPMNNGVQQQCDVNSWIDASIYSKIVFADQLMHCDERVNIDSGTHARQLNQIVGFVFFLFSRDFRPVSERATADACVEKRFILPHQTSSYVRASVVDVWQ